METISWLPGHSCRIRVICDTGRIHKLVLHRGEGPEKTVHDIFLGDHCISDLSKLIFTQSDGVTPFSDYCVEVVDGDRAVVWIKFTTDTVYIYPGADPAAAKNQAAPA